MEYNVEKIRADFPGLNRRFYGHEMVYLDNTATSQTPRQVVDEIEAMYYNRKANVHRGVSSISQEATDCQEATRRRVAGWIGARSVEEVVFTRGTTEGINLVAASFGQRFKAGDEVILTVMEHHSNIVPWQLLASRTGIKLRVVPLCDDMSTLDLEVYRSLFNERTVMASFCHVSNVLGTVNPVAEMIAIAHGHGVPVLVDGAQAVPHMRVDVSVLDADFYVFSAHKMYGPTGVGVLYGKRELLESMPPYQGGGEMIGTVSFEGTTWADLPFKFEAGTPDFVGISALKEAIDYIEGIGYEAIDRHERELLDYATAEMMKIEGMRLFGTACHKSAVISFLIGNAHHYDTGMLLDKLGIQVRTGHHCAEPLMHVLGIEGTVRASLAMYNTFEEIDRFIAALKRIAPMLM